MDEKENTVFISLPGVPYEMKYLVENEIIPKIVKEYKRPYIIHKTILTYGQGESLVAERIENWENNLPEFIKLAYLPNPGRVRLRMTARGTDKEELEKAIEENVQSLDAIIHDIIVGYEENETIEIVVGKLLAKIIKQFRQQKAVQEEKLLRFYQLQKDRQNILKEVWFHTQQKQRLMFLGFHRI